MNEEPDILDKERLNIVCIGAHPDDAETGCGGTLAKLAGGGHQVTILYLTRGEASARRARYADIGKVRTSEALLGCTTLNSRAEFLGQMDGMTCADEVACSHFENVLLCLRPDVVFTHWPQDTHVDHRVAAQLAYHAWQLANKQFHLIYYEVMTGVQTQNFQPNWFVDISHTSQVKRQAIYAHVSQEPDRFYPHHEAMERQRGQEANCERAEAFCVLNGQAPQLSRCCC